MSFNDVGLDSSGSLAVRRARTPDLQEQLSGNIAALRTNNTLLRRLLARLRADSARRLPAHFHADLLRDVRDVRDVRNQNRELARASQKLLEAADDDAAWGGVAATGAGVDPKRLEQLREETRVVLEEFSASLAVSVEQELRLAGLDTEAVVVDVEEGKPGEATALLPKQQQVLQVQNVAMADEVLSNEQFLTERAEALDQVQSSLHDVHSIFKDLAVMIGDQGMQLDQIEVNVASARETTQRAVREVKRTRDRTTRCRKLFFWLLAFATVIISLYILVILS